MEPTFQTYRFSRFSSPLLRRDLLFVCIAIAFSKMEQTCQNLPGEMPVEQTVPAPGGPSPIWGVSCSLEDTREDVYEDAPSQPEPGCFSEWKLLGRRINRLPIPASLSKLIMVLIPRPNTCRQPRWLRIAVANPQSQQGPWVLSPPNP